MNIIFVIIDSMRYDYFQYAKVGETLKCTVHRCVTGECTTSEAVPVIFTGKANPKKRVVDKLNLANGWMWITEINEKTLFDVFRSRGYMTQYINLPQYADSIFDSKLASFFPSFPSGQTVGEFVESCGDAPYFLVIHDWTVHYPYRLATRNPKTLYSQYSIRHIRGAYLQSVYRFKTKILPQIHQISDNAIFVLTADHGENLGETVNGIQRFFHEPPTNKLLAEVPFVSTICLTEKKTIKQQEIFNLILKINQ